MSYHWPADTDFSLWELDVLDRNCPVCGRMMHICDHRSRRFHTLDGPVHLICKLNHCPDRACPGHAKTKSPELEITLALPQMAIGWDVLCWIGHRRCSRHMAISLIRSELWDDYGIKLSDDAIDAYIRRYQIMLAARQQDPESLRRQYESGAEIILCIDGLQPEKGHEALYVVRELTQKRVWFAEPLISATAVEVRRLIQKAKQWAESLGTPVGLWMSDKQEAFVTGIAAEFPEVPHRYCDNHFLRDVAQPVLEADSHAKVQMRKKVRGLRGIEQSVLKRRRGLASEQSPAAAAPAPAAPAPAAPAPAAPTPAPAAPSLLSGIEAANPDTVPAAPDDPAGDVVLDYCAAVRGILNDDQGGPLHPSGLRMAEALHEVQESIQRNLETKKGGSRRSNSVGYRGASRRASTKSTRCKR